MAIETLAQSAGITLKKVSTILVSQPQPQLKSPYTDIENRYSIKVDFRPFIYVAGLEAKDFRKQRVRPDEYTSIILTSKNAVDHFFRLCEEMRIKMTEDIKYFCLTEQIANYLQKFINFRKRKVFNGVKTIHDIGPLLLKHKNKEKYLLPCSNLGALEITNYLKEIGIEFQEAVMFESLCSDLSDLSDVTYDILAFFSPLDIKSLYENFPDFKQNNTRIAVSGTATLKAAQERGLTVNIQTSVETPSMPTAIESYIKTANAL
jgi:uroporphyrinogen-III synthase